jgi:hypothetical protein
MLNTYREAKDTGKLLADRRKKGRRHYQEALETIQNLRRTGEITDAMSFRSIFEAVVPDGHEALHEMQSRRAGGNSLFVEAGGTAINTADFSNIIGQISYADVLSNFDPDANGYIGDKLLTVIPATTGQKEMIPGVTLIGDQAERVGENDDYPTAGIGEQFIVLPEIYKYGFIMNITEETLFEDKTGLVLQNFNKVAEAMAINLEKERLNTVLGVTSSYSRNGGAVQATYGNTHTNGDGDNLIGSNPLNDRTAFNNAKLYFNNLTDPDTGEPISMGRDYQVVVPDALEWTLGDILSAREYQTTPSLGATAVRMKSDNPIYMGGRSYEPLSNLYVSTITGDDTTWFMGNFKKAFVERTIYPTTVEMQDRTSDLAFSRDIISRIKVKRRSQPGVKDWRYVQKHTA